MDPCYRVIIVGAGISGLSAANRLLKNGIKDFLILEAKEKAGGRINTLQDFDGGNIELGAQWIHGEDNDLCQLVNHSGHLHSRTSWEGKGDFLLSNGTKVPKAIVEEILEWIENTIGYIEDSFSIKDLHDNPPSKWGPSYSSMGTFLKERFLKYLDDMGISSRDDSANKEEYDLRMAIFQWGMSFQRIDNSCDQMSDLSLFRWPEFQVNSGELYNNFRLGASCFVNNVLVAPLQQKSYIRYNAPVEQIIWKGNSAPGDNLTKVILRDGSQLFAQSVLVTTSIGVLHKKLKLKTFFSPQLPQALSTAISSTGYGPIGKIFLRWKAPWWEAELEGFQFLWPNEFLNCCDDEEELQDLSLMKERWPKSITGFDPVLDCPNSLLGWLGGPESRFIETLSEREVGEKCAELLRSFTGLHVPIPDGVAVSKWNIDEFFEGAYCYRGTETDKIFGDVASILSEPVYVFDSNSGLQRPAIVLAGEALSKTHYSTLHGAYESGESQTSKILQYFQKNNANKHVVNANDFDMNQHNTQEELPNISMSVEDLTSSMKSTRLDEISQLMCQCQFKNAKDVDVPS